MVRCAAERSLEPRGRASEGSASRPLGSRLCQSKAPHHEGYWRLGQIALQNWHGTCPRNRIESCCRREATLRGTKISRQEVAEYGTFAAAGVSPGPKPDADAAAHAVHQTAAVEPSRT